MNNSILRTYNDCIINYIKTRNILFNIKIALLLKFKFLKIIIQNLDFPYFITNNNFIAAKSKLYNFLYLSFVVKYLFYLKNIL
jgi:hypothetical protein